MRQASVRSVARSHVWSQKVTVCQGFSGAIRFISDDLRADMRDVFDKISDKYPSRIRRDWVPSFGSFITLTARQTIDLKSEIRQ